MNELEKIISRQPSEVNPTPPGIERFWKHLRKCGPDGCWLWEGATDNGYGLWVAATKLKARAHRITWIVFNGPIPDGLCVLHKCDVPLCANPAHLFLGTRTDNMADKCAKGRQPKGESHPLAKMNEEKVREIRKRSEGGETQPSIARAFNISRASVSGIVNRYTWAHVA